MSATTMTTPEHQEVQFTKQAPLEKLRQTKRFTPSTSNNINGRQGEKIYIDVADAESLADLVHSYFLFKISASQTGGTEVRLNNYAASQWIKSIRVMIGGTELEYINDYNVQHRARGEMFLSAEYKNSIFGKDHQGIGDATERLGWATNGKQFAFQPLGFLSTNKYLPLPLLSKMQIQIEMESPENYLTYDGTAPVYTVEYIRYLVDTVTVGEGQLMAMRNNAAQKGVPFHFSTFSNSVRDTPTGTRDSFELGTVVGSVKDIKMITVLDADRDVSTEEYVPSFKLNNLSRYNIRLGHKNLREDQVIVSTTELAEASAELLKSEHLYPLVSIGSSDVTDYTTRFMIGQQVDVSRNPDTLNSVEQRFNNSVQIDVDYSETPGSGIVYASVHVDRTLTFLAGRAVRVE